MVCVTGVTKGSTTILILSVQNYGPVILSEYLYVYSKIIYKVLQWYWLASTHTLHFI